MFHELIEEISNELDIKCTYLSKDWIIKLEKGNRVEYIVGNKFPLNNHSLGLIMDDKYALYDILNNLNIPVCKHYIFYNTNNNHLYAKNCHTKEDVMKCFNNLNRDVVVKINNGSEGKDVYHIKDKNELNKVMDHLFMKNYSISICPYYNVINEYRLVVLNNEVKLIYKKIKPRVIGDGIKSVNDLLKEFNPYYFKDKDISNDILPYNKEYLYDWKFNLSRGSICSVDIEDRTKKICFDVALDVVSKTGISFATIDIIELSNSEFFVLEVNSGVTISKCINFIPSGYKIAKEIYKEAVGYLFRC